MKLGDGRGKREVGRWKREEGCWELGVGGVNTVKIFKGIKVNIKYIHYGI